MLPRSERSNARRSRDAGGGALVGAVQRGTQIDKRADMLELGGGIREQVDRLAEQVDRVFALDGAGECAQRSAARTW